ncbi:MAG: hypothetical protein KF699_15345 [Phycisphaeraceae bacterium]|nr:hypothetical protein [Phycisphaeraceae bacterium]MBX3407316.1 hypothetical protein [Phycisphaeraceae bacterium]
MITRTLDFFGGLYQLARLGAITRFRFRGAYWSWRNQTAFGRGAPASRLETARAVIEYGVWMHRMRTGR